MERLVPSLTTYQQARDEVTLSIRGQSSPGASAQGQNPRVTAYFAEVPLQTGDGGGPGRFFDLQNVQVLKGPQGTFFGRNATGGAVLFEPKRPTDQFEGYAVAQYGRFDDRQLEGAVNLPLADQLAVRVAGKWAKRDGFTRNITTGQMQDDRDYFGGRVSALFKPGGGFESYFMFDYLSNDTNGSSAYFAGYNPDKVLTPDLLEGALPGMPIPLTLAGNGPSIAEFAADPAGTLPAAIAAGRVVFYPDPLLVDQLAAQQAGGPRVTLGNVDGLNKVRAWGFTNISTLALADEVSLKNIFGYRRFKQRSRYDLDGVALPLLDQTTPDGWMNNLRQITEELQVQGRLLDDTLDFTIGTFLLWQKAPSPQTLQQTSVSTPLLT
ncbi:MAG: TonB-dependent receptor plug domain-containing protein, partial [Phenylobacterium sp.]